MGLYTTFLYRPIFNLFVGLYNVVGDAGIVIVLITIAVRLVLYPMYKKQVAAQKSMQDLQPKLQKLKEEYKDDKEKQAMKMMELYKDHKVNPFSSCLPVLIQFPLFIAVYQVLRDGLTKSDSLDLLYTFVTRPDVINPSFIGIIDLSTPNVILAVAAGVAQFFQARMLLAKRPEVKSEGSKDEDTMAIMNKQMTYIMPVMITFFGLTLPSGLSLYWVISTLFMLAQQVLVFNKKEEGVTQIDEKTQVIANKK